MTTTRLLTAALLAALGCLLAVGAAWRPGESAGSAVTSVADRVAPLTVLADWDRARAAAWRDGDQVALGRLYVAGSEAGGADGELLAAYAGRGLRVTGLRMQRAAVEVVSEEPERLVLVVTDRVVGGTAVGPGGRIELPRDDWSRRRVVLRASATGWQVARVREVSAARPPAPS